MVSIPPLRFSGHIIRPGEIKVHDVFGKNVFRKRHRLIRDGLV